MEVSDTTLMVLAIILFFGLIAPNLFSRVELPFASTLIILGAALGPFGLNYIHPDETMKLFGFLGAAFHMLLAGLEAETFHIRKSGKRLWIFTAFSSVIPFITGTLIVRHLSYSWDAALFMGAVFISSSILIVFANVRSFALTTSPLAKDMKSMAVIQDLVASLLIFVLFKYTEPHQRFPLPILLGLLVSSVVILRMFLPEVIAFFFQRFERRKTGHESRLRLVIALLLLIIAMYSALDVHPVIAAFLVGFILSEVPSSEDVQKKLYTIGYALFIPVFLFVIGFDLDLRLFTQLHLGNSALLVIVLGALLSKYLSTHLGAWLSGYAQRDATLLGISSITKLTVTISAAYAALELELIDHTLYTSIIAVSVISTMLNPVMMWIVMKRWKKPVAT